MKESEFWRKLGERPQPITGLLTSLYGADLTRRRKEKARKRLMEFVEHDYWDVEGFTSNDRRVACGFLAAMAEEDECSANS